MHFLGLNINFQPKTHHPDFWVNPSSMMGLKLPPNV
jgi:hypothetical protein